MGTSSRSRLARVGLLALLVIAVGCSSNQATPKAKSRTSRSTTTVAMGKHVSSEVSFDAPTLLAPACGSTGACVYPLSRTTTRVKGSFTGSTVSAGAGSPTKSGGGYAGVGYQLFTGTVKGCGSGTVVWTEVTSTNDGTNVSGAWTIRNGTGTAGLASVSGGGRFTGKTNRDSSGAVTATGTIHC
jgi:hypothetical protein